MSSVFQHTACVIRTYNNNDRSIEAIWRALEADVRLVIVVVNGHAEADRGRVRRECDDLSLFQMFGDRLVLIEMEQGWTWCSALNTAIEAVRQHNTDPKKGRITHFLSASVEAEWTRDDLSEMIEAMVEGIGAVGTTFSAFKRVGEEFQCVDLGRTYLQPRNTCMVWRWTLIDALGGFDPQCDLEGGMEDVDTLIRAFIGGHYQCRMIDQAVPLQVSVHWDQAEKEERELDALRKIVRRHHSRVSSSDKAWLALEQVVSGLGYAGLFYEALMD